MVGFFKFKIGQIEDFFWFEMIFVAKFPVSRGFVSWTQMHKYKDSKPKSENNEPVEIGAG